MDLDAEFMKLRGALDDFQAVAPFLKVLSADPDLLRRVAADSASSAQAAAGLMETVQKLSGDVAVLAQRVEAVEGGGAADNPARDSVSTLHDRLAAVEHHLELSIPGLEAPQQEAPQEEPQPEQQAAQEGQNDQASGPGMEAGGATGN